MGIVTTYVCPPIPDRGHDWHAHFDWQCADDLSCEGYGETEESAVIDLLNNALEVDLDGSEQEEVIDLAIRGFAAMKDEAKTRPATTSRNESGPKLDRQCRREIEGSQDG